MTNPQTDLLELTHRIVQAIHAGDIETYASLCVGDMTCYENDVAPYRIEGVDFHAGMMAHSHEHFAALERYDLLSPIVQVYGDCGVVTYTRLMSFRTANGLSFKKSNESRVYAKIDEMWKMVHFHRFCFD